MAVTIGIILFIITLIIIGLIFRKRIYDNVDQYEAWKLDVMNRNVASELARIKSLNLSGETQEKFEAWKERWDYILSKELPDVEEYLFDAEEAADRYRFSTAKKVLHKIENALHAIEAEIEQMLNELEELLTSEERSRREVEELQPTIKNLRQKLTKNRYQYGKAESYFETEFDELEQSLETYFELIHDGNYMKATNLVENLKPKLQYVKEQLNTFPDLYKTCKDGLPKQFDELLHGLKSMKEEGYQIEHLGFEKDIHQYKQRLEDCVSSLDNGDTDDVASIIKELEERIQEMYDLLEKEAVAKSYIETELPRYEKKIEELNDTFIQTKEEVDELRKAYYFEERDLEKLLLLESSLTQLKNQLEQMTNEEDIEEISYLETQEKIEQGLREIEEMHESYKEFHEQIHNLRKDELDAKEQLSDMREQINNAKRKMKKSNIPGVPNFIWTIVETAIDKNSRVIKALESQPLDINEVRNALSEAKLSVDHLTEQTDVMLEQAYLTEQVIQYANRYRSRHPLLAEKLRESERLFRAYEYELSLEQAATAVEEVEPGSLKRIEAYQEVN